MTEIKETEWKSRHAEALGRLLPPVSYHSKGELLGTSLLIDGLQLDRGLTSATRLLDGLNPLSGIFIDDWERVCGLKANRHLPLEQRIARLIDKLNEKGTLSIPFIKQKAKALGYEITIFEPEPFRAGVSRCGEILWDKGVIYMFFVDIGVPAYLYSGNYALDRYGVQTISDPILEAMLNEIKPAHTRCWVRYFKG